ncbi:hypothetical protein [Mucilaginibacter sp. dw_454]|uniref:beta strand repeat-containing protein n=1 Tax=Mucilaginibacter sp. dw_454 TaxID=2720079 RepID=UPI001BD6C30E|nr:hypothetical protein [Mucilaginibacter sp. dw_454]
MKKISSLFCAMLLISQISYAQWAQIGTSGNYSLNSGHAIIGGTTTPSAFLHVIGTTEQLRLAYDPTHYNSFTVNSVGNLLINPTGGHIGLGTIQIASTLYNSLGLTGGTTSYGFYGAGTIQSDVTSTAYYFLTGTSTVAASFNVGNLYHFSAQQGTFGAGSTVTNQYGFAVASTLIGANNNYGFYGAIPSGTNRWNLYMAGAAPNFLAGQLGIGTSTLTNAAVDINLAGIANGTTSRGTYIHQSIPAGANNGNLVALDINPTFTNPGTGVLATSTLTGGSGYTNGTYTLVPLTGGSGTGAIATIVVAGGAVTTLNITTNGTGYTVADALSAAASFDGVGSGSGFSITVATIGYTGVTAYGIRSLLGFNYFVGNVGINSTPTGNVSLYNAGSLTANGISTTAYANYTSKNIQSDVTNTALGYSTSLSTQAASFTLGNLYHYVANQSTIGAGSTVTNQYGFAAGNSLVGATNNYGFFGNLGAGTGRYNLYMSGTAVNYMAGNLGLGVSSPTTALQISGNRTQAAWGVVGGYFYVGQNSLIDNSTAANASVNNNMVSSFAQATLSATNSGITYVNASTVYIAGPPLAGTNTTLTHSYALYSGSGTNYFGGNVGIGTTTPREALSVNGNIRSKQVKVELANWPDYVFKPAYYLPSLADLKIYIDANHHLPDMPTEQEVTKDGLNLGEVVKLQTQKIEELTLYVIQEQAENGKLKKEQQNQQQQIDQLKIELTALTKALAKN